MKKLLIFAAIIVFALAFLASCRRNGDEETLPGQVETPTAAPGDTAQPPAPGAEGQPADVTGIWTPEGLVVGLEGHLVVSGTTVHFNTSDPDLGGVFEYFSTFYPNFSTRLLPRDSEHWAVGVIQELIAAGDTPDVFITRAGDIPELASMGVLLPLNDLLEQFPEYAATLIPAATELNSVGDTIYGISWQLLPTGWITNVDLFERMGVPIPSPDWTIEDLIATNHRMVDRPNLISGQQGDLMMMLHNFKVSYGVVGTRVEDGLVLSAYADDPNTIPAIESAIRLLFGVDSQFTDAERAAIGPAWNSHWTQGHSAWVPWSLWAMPFNAELNRPAFNVTVLPPPAGPTGIRTAGSETITMVIFAHTEQPELAFRYIMAKTSQHFFENAEVLELRTDPPTRLPLGFSPDEMRFPIGLPPIDIPLITHPELQPALDGFVAAARYMSQSPFSVPGNLFWAINAYVVNGDRAIADVLREWDAQRNETIRAAAGQ